MLFYFLENDAVISEDECSTDSEVDESFVQLSYTSSSMTGPIGQWEEHTKV